MTRVLAITSIAVAAVVAGAQQRAPVVPLTGADYVEIKNAYGRSLHAERDLRHWITNLAIEPSPEGALAWPYVLQSRGREFTDGSLYRDRWVKTPGGWRISTRETFPGNKMPAREDSPAPSNTGSTRFTPRDYFEIENRLTRYNLGWDNARTFDGGGLASLSFTRDALFERPGGDTRRGREGIFDQVKASANPKPGLHHWDGNLLMDVDVSGQVETFGYDVLLNIAEPGSPVRVNATGTLVHRFARTAEGWLINYRIYKALSAVPKISWPASTLHLEARELAKEPGSAAAREARLSPIDYVQIDQLYSRNNVAFDSGSEHGAAFARTFTPDGVWTRQGVTTSGTSALAALAAANTAGLETWTSNLTLEATKDGAIGRVYVLMKDGQNTSLSVADLGTFEDVLVKTRDGWRFKRRTYISESGAPAGTDHKDHDDQPQRSQRTQSKE